MTLDVPDNHTTRVKLGLRRFEGLITVKYEGLIPSSPVILLYRKETLNEIGKFYG